MNKKLSELIWLVVGAGIAMTLVLLLVSDRFSPLILAPLAGSAVYLFALTAADEPR
jgi:CBS-domain-containing membrane protein